MRALRYYSIFRIVSQFIFFNIQNLITTFWILYLMAKPQRVLDGNRITLPLDFINKHKIKEGAFVLVEETNGGSALLITPAKVVPQ